VTIILFGGMTLLYVYGLLEPETKIIRYVGQTNKPQKRLNDHISEAKTNLKFNRKNNWIRSLLKENKKPEIMILEEVETIDLCNKAEVFHIAQMLDCGFDLTNATSGGDGFYTRSKESIQRFADSRRGKKFSEETKQKMKLSAKSRMTPEEIERLRSISNGNPPHFYGEQVSTSKLKEEDVVYIRRQLNSGSRGIDICNQFPNISKSAIYSAAMGKNWQHVDEPVFKPRKMVKLTEENVREIRSLLSENVSQSEIARRFNIHPSTVSDIKRNKRRNNVK